MEHICIITSKYPTRLDNTALTFVQQLAWGMADEGKEISVICPLPVNLNPAYAQLPDSTEEKTPDGNTVSLYLPKYMGFGQRTIGSYNTAGLTTHFFIRAVRRVLRKMKVKPDALYGHFVTPSGLTACELAKEFKLPAYIAYGESSTWSIDHIGRQKVAEAIADVNGIIAVSTKNKDELLDIGLAAEDKVKVFPNGYDPKRFSPRSREESREHFNLPQDAFIVAFVGHFIKRKGIDVLCDAVNQVEDTYLICAGKGKLQPEGDRVLYAQPVSPDELAFFYSAADVFVLPTLNEGCCNAIIEAMACGLPIISSDRTFNYDILSEANSILINPENADEIADAIRMLKDNESMKKSLGENSLGIAERLTLERRVKNILQFMAEKEES